MDDRSIRAKERSDKLMNLKIKNITCSIKKVPLKRPFITALHKVTEIEGLKIVVELSDGRTGTGTATPNEKVTGDTLQSSLDIVNQVIKPALISQDFKNWNKILTTLQTCIVHNTAAKAAMDIALHQLKAKENNESLVNLLGSEKGKLTTDYTISIGSDDHMVSEAKALVKDGFTAIKIKLGNNSVSHDIKTIQKISKAVGPDISLRIDCNQAWNYKDTLKASRTWAQDNLNIDFIEQPVLKDAISDLTLLSENSPYPIMADESVASYQDAINLIQHHACDYINIKLMKTGGLSEAIKINDLAQACGIKTMIGCMIEPVESIAAAAAFAVANKSVKFIDLDSIFMATQDPDLSKYLEIKNNEIILKD